MWKVERLKKMLNIIQDQTLLQSQDLILNPVMKFQAKILLNYNFEILMEKKREKV